MNKYKLILVALVATILISCNKEVEPCDCTQEIQTALEQEKMNMVNDTLVLVDHNSHFTVRIYPRPKQNLTDTGVMHIGITHPSVAQDKNIQQSINQIFNKR